MLLTRRLFLASASSAGFVGRCGSGANPPPPPGPPPPAPPPPGQVTFNFSFADNFAGWEPAIADYALGQESSIGFAFGHERLPPSVDDRSGIYLQSTNVADDVFMYVSRLLDGLAAGARYRVELSVTLATNAPPDCVGIGGAPGEAVTVKAGASRVRPDKVVEQGFVRTNFDKGNQTQGGRDVIAIGNLAQNVPAGDCLAPLYSRKTLATGSGGPVVSSDSHGRLWLIIGTDSGFEGLTRVYLLEGSARLTRV
ncbi:hypothetical protein [Sphingosinicella sp. CPCC 101087]|uniref:hypothetical protein n=1 Tax=Sphingosinicella sp. CPCC 101087 TaxID=2497754 RepID=UPI00101CC299|nr:hypothetical protein [Sphingosinicella sp. CPCC 101087]